jgi:hypothetical protein
VVPDRGLVHVLRPVHRAHLEHIFQGLAQQHLQCVLLVTQGQYQHLMLQDVLLVRLEHLLQLLDCQFVRRVQMVILHMVVVRRRVLHAQLVKQVEPITHIVTIVRLEHILRLQLPQVVVFVQLEQSQTHLVKQLVPRVQAELQVKTVGIV